MLVCLLCETICISNFEHGRCIHTTYLLNNSSLNKSENTISLHFFVSLHIQVILAKPKKNINLIPFNILENNNTFYIRYENTKKFTKRARRSLFVAYVINIYVEII